MVLEKIETAKIASDLGKDLILGVLKDYYGQRREDKRAEVFRCLDVLYRKEENKIQDFTREFKAAARTVEKELRVKWPNDIFVEMYLSRPHLVPRHRTLVISLAQAETSADDAATAAAGAGTLTGLSLDKVTTVAVHLLGEQCTLGPHPLLSNIPEDALIANAQEEYQEEACYWQNTYGKGGKGFKGQKGQKGGKGTDKGKGKGTNPKRPDGSVSACVICGSRFHWKRDCPEDKSEVKQVF